MGLRASCRPRCSGSRYGARVNSCHFKCARFSCPCARAPSSHMYAAARVVTALPCATVRRSRTGLPGLELTSPCSPLTYEGAPQIDGIWHTGVVVDGREYFFGQGIQHCPAAQSPFGAPLQVIPLGCAPSPPRRVQGTSVIVLHMGSHHLCKSPGRIRPHMASVTLEVRKVGASHVAASLVSCAHPIAAATAPVPLVLRAAGCTLSVTCAAGTPRSPRR